MRDAFGADRLAQPYRRIRGVERILDQFGSRQLKQPRNLHDGSLHLGDVRQWRRGERISDPVSNTRVNSTDLPMLLRRRIPDSSSSLIDLRCGFPKGRCSPIRISPDVTIQTTLRSNRAAPSRSTRTAAQTARRCRAIGHLPDGRGRAGRSGTPRWQCPRTSRSLSDVPLRNLTSFSFAAASIAGGRHHDRRYPVKRQRMRMNHDCVVLALRYPM